MQIGRLGHFLQSVGLAHGVANAEIAHRQNIGPLECKHHKYLRRPNPNASHLCQHLKHVLVVQSGQLLETDLTACDTFREIG
jgi:hypothetical protein